MVQPTEGSLRVYHLPQVGIDAVFFVDVATVDEAVKVITTIWSYDLFQYQNKIKPDYANSSGLEIFEDGEWMEFEDNEGFTIDEIISNMSETN